MRNPVFAVEDVINQVNLLRLEYPALNDDERLLADTIEGETDMHNLIDRLVSLVNENDALAEAMAARVAKLRERQTRVTMKMNFYRNLIHKLMTAADMKSVATPEGKVSVVSAPDKVVITDEHAIPDQYQRIKKEPDKAAIKKALAEGKSIDGAVLSNGGTTIQIR